MADQKLSELSAPPSPPQAGDRFYLIRGDGASPQGFTGYQADVEDLLGGSISTDYEPSVLVGTDASDGNITLSGLYTLQGIALADGDRVLPTQQTAGANNRVWLARAGAWDIAEGWDTGDTVTAGRIVPIDTGDNAGKKFQLLTTGVIVPGTTALTWDIDASTFVSNFVGQDKNGAANAINTTFQRTWNYATRNGVQSFTLQTHATQPLPVGTELVVQMIGTGVKTINGVSATVSLNGVANGSVTLSVAYDAYLLKKRSNNVWTATPFKAPFGGLDAMVFRGVIDCSANPNYPAADAGDTYRVSVAGKIGGGSGPNVEVGDLLICLTDGTASGTHAAVGASWSISQSNIDGAVINTRQIISGAGLTGGGDLSANRTLAVGAGTGILANADDVAVDKASDANVRAAASNKVVTADLIESASAFVALTDAATVALDWDAAINFSLTIGGNRTLGNATNGQPGTWRTIVITQDGTGSRTLAYGNQYIFPGGTEPVLTMTPTTGKDVLNILCETASLFHVYSAADMKV